jgi:hypothetical protein
MILFLDAFGMKHLTSLDLILIVDNNLRNMGLDYAKYPVISDSLHSGLAF